MLKHRIMSGCLLGAGLIVAAYLLPALAVWLLLVTISCFAQLEFYTLVSRAGIPTFRIVGLICGALLISATFFKMVGTSVDVVGVYDWENLVLPCTLIAVFVRQFPQKHNDKPLETIGCTLLGIWYVPYLFNFLTRLSFAWDGDPDLNRIGTTGRMLILFLIVVVKSSDMGAYFVGSAFGRRKLMPRVSPGKTWEGLAGGVAASLLASWLFYLLGGGRLGTLFFGPPDVVVLGCLLPVVGVVGDMFESLLKRAVGAKDSSSTIPGMGGILDILDSLLFGAPVLYVYVRVFMQ
jgi:phosphatidate cytidylyltransferase